MALPDRFHFERERVAQGDVRIAGIDEAGRGPLAGPVVVAAVMFPCSWISAGIGETLAALNDSKALSAKRRDVYFDYLVASPEILRSIISIEPKEIDRVNILQATHSGMLQSIDGLCNQGEDIDHVLVDGLPVASIKTAQTALVKGDSKSYSIAAASILAKVTRDRAMMEYEKQYPGYGFAQHKGYPTRAHLDALRRLGPCPIHRQSFAPVRQQQLDLL